MFSSSFAFIIILLTSTVASAAISEYEPSVEGSGNGLIGSYWFDDELLKNQFVKISNENICSKMENSSKRLAHEMSSMQHNMKLLDYKIIMLAENIQEIKELILLQPAYIQFKDEHSKNVSREYNVENKTEIPLEQPTSCAEALHYRSPSGVYKLHLPDSGLEPFDVYCLKDPNRGPAWTIVQRRQYGSVDFYREWKEYKSGFGNLSGEYFIGLDKLHALTTDAQLQELWIELKDYEDNTKYANYEFFAVGNEHTKYTLMMLGKYSGNAGDSLIYHKGQKFTTKDSDNDLKNKENCAVKFTGAWWYDKCYFSNLNGQYGKEKESKGINWNEWRKNYNLKYVHLAIRPVK